MFQLRTYTLASAEAADRYLSVHWPRHLESLPAFGITVHGVWRSVDPDAPARVLALVSFAPGADIAAVNAAYMQSDAFRADMDGFDVSAIRAVEAQLLATLPGLPPL
ncbi:NIPSNAP domain-containing protein (plasmid) [Azospirillum humicireducens]|uniref:NIPSNAP domain-containing protein n=1 Tax=Azospirillum humicireducens TaxID=1226968 RepID=A0A2R4VTQ2_9PROT|nr:NIPSNAP family protein [Azospirillum humicireducens]AWB07820.1 NIPSNAP domain-containing protein [Azospirillum humicireducens]